MNSVNDTFQQIQEAVEERDYNTAEELVESIECCHELTAIARKIYGQMTDPSCYTFEHYKRLLERCAQGAGRCKGEIKELLYYAKDLEDSLNGLEEYFKEEEEN